MKRGYLSQFFLGVAVKRLTAVEARPETSHQHEFNGVSELKSIFGEAGEPQEFHASFIYLSDDESDPVTSDGFVTWYDARRHKRPRKEARLYFPTTQVSGLHPL